MDLKLILSTFFVIFLAELGDKTQFAAMAASAGSNKPASVLIGAILALALSSVIAVAAGSLLGKYIPIKFIKLAAGALFIVFGVLYLREAFVTEQTVQQPESLPAAEQESVLGDSILMAARTFENLEIQMMDEALKNISNPDCRTVIGNILMQEKEHAEALSAIEHDESIPEPLSPGDLGIPEKYACRDSDGDAKILSDILERERAISDFYLIMSRKARIASVKNTLFRLHTEELKHAEAVEALL